MHRARLTSSIDSVSSAATPTFRSAGTDSGARSTKTGLARVASGPSGRFARRGGGGGALDVGAEAAPSRIPFSPGPDSYLTRCLTESWVIGRGNFATAIACPRPPSLVKRHRYWFDQDRRSLHAPFCFSAGAGGGVPPPSGVGGVRPLAHMAGLSATEHQRALRSACVARAPLPTISSPSQQKMRASGCDRAWV